MNDFSININNFGLIRFCRHRTQTKLNWQFDDKSIQLNPKKKKISLVLFSIFLSGLWFLFLICLDLNTPNNKDHKFLR